MDIKVKQRLIGALVLGALAVIFVPMIVLGPEPEGAAEATGVDWPALIDKCIGLWAAGHFDRGQALWSPAPGNDAFAAWRAWALHDLTPEIAGLKGFCAHVACAPDTAERAILSAAETLGIHEAAAPNAAGQVCPLR